MAGMMRCDGSDEDDGALDISENKFSGVCLI